MKKTFNTTGVCINELNYMVDINNKLEKIEKMIDRGEYFVINRPRQYGKTTTMYLLEEKLKDNYNIISLTFEGLGDIIFNDEERFYNSLSKLIVKDLKYKDKSEALKFKYLSEDIKTLQDFSECISDFIEESDKEYILFIDEVDKTSNNQLFLSFLGMLRSKYLLARQRKDKTFKSVILAGVHDIKNLKLKIRDDDDKKYNSPWNIAVDFDIDMSFNKEEIKTMLDEYCIENNITMDTDSLSENIHYYTNGYPFLVSRICQIIDEKLLEDGKRPWNKDDIQKSVKYLLRERNTLFDDLIKNIENNEELYNTIYGIVIDGNRISFNRANPIIDLGHTYGIFKEDNNTLKLNNRIYEQYIYDYITSKIEIQNHNMSIYNFKNNFIENGNLNIEKVIDRFQQFMKEQYSSLDQCFVEREGRLLFLAFIKPIINGVGFDFKEVQISEEKRLDVVITYNSKKYIVELKIWRGEQYHQSGLEQLADYLEINNLDKGYMVVFNFNKGKEYKKESVTKHGKLISIVYV